MNPRHMLRDGLLALCIFVAVAEARVAKVLEHHFEQVAPVQEVAWVFGIPAPKHRALKIKRVRPACDQCMEVTVSQRFVPAGGAAQVVVTLDTTELEGDVERTIQVETDDPERPVIVLKLTATVVPEVRIEPKQFSFGRLTRGTRGQAEVMLRPAAVGQFEVLNVHTSAEFLTVISRRAVGPDAGGYYLFLRLDPNAPIGPIHGTVTVKTDCKVRPTFAIPVRGEVLGPVQVEPVVLGFGPVNSADEPTRTIGVRGAKASNLRISDVDTDLEQIELSVRELEPGADYEITVRVRRDAAEGRFGGKVHIHTNNPAQPRLSVSVYGFVRKADGGLAVQRATP